MGRLTTLKPKVGTLAPRLKRYAPGDETDRSRFRDETQAWRKWYKTAKWQKLRWSILVRDKFTCRMCKKLETATSLLVCDHVEQHHGDEAAFWSGPFQTLCKTCHDSTKQKQERQAW